MGTHPTKRLFFRRLAVEKGTRGGESVRIPAIAKNSKRRRQWQERRAWAVFSSKRAGGGR